MIYRTITTFLHDINAPAAAFEMAISAARDWGAHLHVICAGVNFSEPGYYYADTHMANIQLHLEEAQIQAKALQAFAKKRLEREDIAYDIQTVTLIQHGLSIFLGEQLRFSDMVFLPRPYTDSNNRINIDVFEACLFNADRPVMVVPPDWNGNTRFENILVAWDDGSEALAACRAAIPLLNAAKKAEICIIDPPRHAEDRSDPGGRLAQYLAHFDVRAEINVMARTQPSLAMQLTQRATEQGDDLLVMGAYGHSRLREAVLGGVTRHMLQHAEVPMLMAR